VPTSCSYQLQPGQARRRHEHHQSLAAACWLWVKFAGGLAPLIQAKKRVALAVWEWLLWQQPSIYCVHNHQGCMSAGSSSLALALLGAPYMGKHVVRYWTAHPSS